eukprot:9471546-Pyramimonas_sp.AAC.1
MNTGIHPASPDEFGLGMRGSGPVLPLREPKPMGDGGKDATPLQGSRRQGCNVARKDDAMTRNAP